MMRINLRSFTLFLMMSSLMLLASPSFLFAQDSLSTRVDTISDSESALVLIDETESSGCRVSINGGKQLECLPRTVYTTEVWPLSKAKATEGVVYVQLDDQNKADDNTAHERLREKANGVTDFIENQTPNSDLIKEQTANSRSSCPINVNISFGAQDNAGKWVSSVVTYERSWLNGQCENVRVIKNTPSAVQGNIYLTASIFSHTGIKDTDFTWYPGCELQPYISDYPDVYYPRGSAVYGYHLSDSSYCWPWSYESTYVDLIY